ncbi:MAG: hypothetical protein H7839_23840 [Magnetococcus sp. YQC-5]
MDDLHPWQPIRQGTATTFLPERLARRGIRLVNQKRSRSFNRDNPATCCCPMLSSVVDVFHGEEDLTSWESGEPWGQLPAYGSLSSVQSD